MKEKIGNGKLNFEMKGWDENGSPGRLETCLTILYRTTQK
jgi:hypothetical protein